MKTLGTTARHHDRAAALVLLLPAILLAAPENTVDANKRVLVIHVGKAARNIPRFAFAPQMSLPLEGKLGRSPSRCFCME